MKYIKGDPTPGPTPGTDALLTAALELAAHGVRVFPCHRVAGGECTCEDAGACKSPGKHPRTKTGSKEATTDPEQIKLWWAKWGKSGRLNFGQTLAGRAVVDIDVADGKTGDVAWGQLLAQHDHPEPDTLTYRTGRGGTQFVFVLPEGESGGKADGYSNKLTDAVDFKTGPNAYVMVPGSKTVDVYTVTVASATAELPAWIATLAREAGKQTVEIDGKAHTITGTSKLADLIALPADHPARGNDWLAKVAGHYAKLYRDKKDLYLVHCVLMNGMSAQPIGADDFTKTTESIWNTEQTKQLSASGEGAGWLISGGDHMLVEIKPQPEGPAEPPDSFADFDLKAVGLISTPGRRGRQYDVILTRQRDGEQFSDVLDSEILVDYRKFTTWLAQTAGVSFALPGRAVGDMNPTIRVMRYLETQKPPVSRLVAQIGYQPEEKVFLTPEGRIEAGQNGLLPFSGVRPRPKLPGFDRYEPPFTYGFAAGGREELRKIIAEVMTFHDETALRVFMSWALMSLVKSDMRMNAACAVFPIFAIEAVSGSGKTSGALKMIGELCGYSLGDVQPTVADLRDKLAAFRSGFIHFDDPNDLKSYDELLRMVPMESTKSKRQDAEHSMSAKLTGGLLITGEGLGLDGQKALADRLVSVSLPSTKGQRSYDHVKDLWQAYGGSLSAVAGTLVSEVLRHREDLPALVKSLKPTDGRAGDSYGIVRAGARLLDWLLDPQGDWGTATGGEGHSAAVVDAWAAAAVAALPDDTEDMLSRKILPWAIRQFSDTDDFDQMIQYKGYRPKVYPAKLRDASTDDARTKTPYEGEGPWIYFNASELAEVWTMKEGKGDETRLASASAITRQAQALGAAPRPTPVTLGGTKKARYWVLSGPIAQTVIERSME